MRGLMIGAAAVVVLAAAGIDLGPATDTTSASVEVPGGDVGAAATTGVETAKGGSTRVWTRTISTPGRPARTSDNRRSITA